MYRGGICQALLDAEADGDPCSTALLLAQHSQCGCSRRWHALQHQQVRAADQGLGGLMEWQLSCGMLSGMLCLVLLRQGELCAEVTSAMPCWMG